MQTRRQFISAVAAAAGAAGAASVLGCNSPLAALSPAPGAPGASASTGSVADAALELSIARANPQVEGLDMQRLATRLTESALLGLGGMQRFVSRGSVVWIKPNIGWNRAPELAANTNPDVVATLVRLCFEAGAAKVKVGDHTCHESRQTYVTSGIAAAAEKLGATVIHLDESRFREVKLGGERLQLWPLAPEIIEADLVINVPVVKHHSLTQTSLCMKNYMGVVGKRPAWHQDMETCLVDITRYMKPRLCVLDAVRLLTANGPTGGDVGDVRMAYTVAAGTDIVGLDAFGGSLLGHDPATMPILRRAVSNKLGQLDWKKLRQREDTVTL